MYKEQEVQVIHGFRTSLPFCAASWKPTDRRRAFRVCIAWLFDLYQTTPFLNLAKRNTYSHSWAKHDLTNPILILLTMLWWYPVLTWLCWLPLMVTHRFVDLLFFNPTHNNPCCCIIVPRTPSLSTMGIQYILQCAACSRARIIVTMENRGQSLLWRNTPANHCGPCRFSIPAQNWRENTFARFTTDSH